MHLYISPRIQQLIDLAIDEDEIGFDVTSQAFFAGEHGRAELVAKESFVLAGQPVVNAVFARVDPQVKVHFARSEGARFEAGEVVASLEGPTVSLLRGERIALNFMQRMSGVATLTAAFVAALGESPTRVVDTRKTLPGWRALDKYAVVCGGGANHRYNLASGVMIKDNHIAAAGSIREALARVRRQAPHSVRVEVEITELAQVEEALDAGAEIVMLDNMNRDQMIEAVAQIRGHRRGNDVVIEGSGNMTRARLEHLGDVGLDIISVGALTHSATAVDVSMKLRSSTGAV
ncbi:carboxylating nicotinate-nucleotide diphosphorylase [Lujinxingia litoralis]|uniref:Probable nicotinate-nucleotide pyrophosphorylase [carboxylating] n=1 Tax=Lujinxingia litoralis TaxID=2211119 RepID=A0A328C6N6_9DELT|nr:carboxylating nicotinate-nucleotide diphosphorylase [Lujinxingia litoralis]RAL22218.1 carboxylating nicotinate-nucleotide diphosphorylase [Lujinxingia litoralis]